MSSTFFTCNCCVIQFKTSDLQRYHMKTEWHRYNLKRRIANLPPIGAEQFAEKLQISEKEQAENQVDEFGFPVLKPVMNQSNVLPQKQKKPIKSKRGRKVGTNLLKRKDRDIAKEKQNRSVSPSGSISSQLSNLTVGTENTNTDYGEDTVSEYGFTSDSNYEYATSDEELDIADKPSDKENEKITITECIYCGKDNKEVERNVKHMFSEHGLFIPERSYLIDLNGLLEFLIKMIVIDHNCLCCNFHGSGLESIRAHMASKRHCRLPYETKEERQLFAPFYDFTYDDHSISKNLQNDRAITSKLSSVYGAKNDEEDGEVDITLVSSENDINANYTTVSIDESGLELTLPTGARLGHRAGQRYYRQNLPSQPNPNESRRTITAADRRMVSGVTEKQYKKGMKKMQQLEKNAINTQIRREIKRVNFQTHYRDELLQ
ncbi:zinc finger protein reh1 [Saccharomyces cerevisiae]|nr:Reh1p [Saccharomyces cerevisiae YJM1387]AJV59890.1 Reh1p [Saccharomyces cerevisiae YJM1389]AJV67003.1 Reh1p [Saccharomyces cerevisiae YJM1460]AJV71491.1 Reh1p [Saccharomyces cerevisiae YJM1592]AJV78545.1 Reh1p [Saccharomyces cerevisiae YJM470]KAF4000928.1 Cytoplasmic 60S subunit biogenesis factor REH1 [Saccharomyces cerevisiae]